LILLDYEREELDEIQSSNPDDFIYACDVVNKGTLFVYDGHGSFVRSQRHPELGDGKAYFITPNMLYEINDRTVWSLETLTLR